MTEKLVGIAARRGGTAATGIAQQLSERGRLGVFRILGSGTREIVGGELIGQHGLQTAGGKPVDRRYVHASGVGILMTTYGPSQINGFGGSAGRWRRILDGRIGFWRFLQKKSGTGMPYRVQGVP